MNTEKPTVELSKNLDLYRETPLRYLGYANEVGEAFRRQIGAKWAACTYGVATLYVLADTTDKTLDVYKHEKFNEKWFKKVTYKASDVLVWQMLASVIIPGFTINRICAVSSYCLKKSKKLPSIYRKWIVTAVGLSAIPFIIKPIDQFTDRLLDESVRKLAP